MSTTPELRSETDARMKREHREKYAALALKIDVADLVRPLLPRVKAAIAAGDEHLNTIPLGRWEQLAGYISGLTGNGPTRCSFWY